MTVILAACLTLLRLGLWTIALGVLFFGPVTLLTPAIANARSRRGRRIHTVPLLDAFVRAAVMLFAAGVMFAMSLVALATIAFDACYLIGLVTGNPPFPEIFVGLVLCACAIGALKCGWLMLVAYWQEL